MGIEVACYKIVHLQFRMPLSYTTNSNTDLSSQIILNSLSDGNLFRSSFTYIDNRELETSKCVKYCCPVLKATHFLSTTFTNTLNYPLVGTLECVGFQGNEPEIIRSRYEGLFV